MVCPEKRIDPNGMNPLIPSLVLAVTVSATVSITKAVGDQPYVLEKGTIQVPENRDRPDSRTITLPFHRLRAASSSSRPLFLFNGGPGSSNLSFSLVPRALWGTRDLVLVGYRGVDGPSLLPDAALTRTLWNLDPELSEDCLRQIAAEYSRFVSSCRSQGIDIDGYSPEEVAADAEALRVHLGYSAIDVYGQSYGTRLTYLYARDFPETVSRVVMSGANPPGHFVVVPSDIDSVISSYGARDTRDLPAVTRRVSSQMPDHWLWWPIDRGKVKLGAQLLLGNPDTAAAVFEAYTKADRGDASALAGLTLLAPFLTTGMHAGDLFLKGLGDFELGRDYLGETADGEQMGRAFLRGTFAVAQFISPADLPQRRVRPVTRVDAPTLVLNGDLDSQTPLRGVLADMMPLLSQGELLVLSSYGHFNAVSDQPTEFTRVVAQFLDSGTVASSFPPGVVPQKPSMDLSSVAWGATGAVVSGVLGLGGLIWWLVAQ